MSPCLLQCQPISFRKKGLFLKDHTFIPFKNRHFFQKGMGQKTTNLIERERERERERGGGEGERERSKENMERSCIDELFVL